MCAKCEVCALQQFHAAGKAHQDLSKGNIMFSLTAPFMPKLIDASRAMDIQPWQMEPIFVGRNWSMRGTNAFKGLMWTGGGDLCAGVRTCLAMVTTKAFEGDEFRAASRALSEATAQAIAEKRPGGKDHPTVVAAAGRYLKARDKADNKCIDDICGMLPESTAAEVKELLEHLLGLGDMTPYGPTLPKIYEFFRDTIEMIVDEIDKGPDTYHKDDLETAFEQAILHWWAHPFRHTAPSLV
ncbi:unnamed protein product [Vitrella brassicaformis CCMP3155]|uniref:Protein kinase domain-containing protein n=1 Tax=Vitrella brassicaformis (strain CCMP3155) TaxID=1169540 RepID=A0A0G4EED5_VITBC|nr:unnamed protein product [Vitrella brassicaformis CCMP3155]|eukprot:CEL93747.1 unnamed protein product [Vitrella brassicaformis CCMP3155]